MLNSILGLKRLMQTRKFTMAPEITKELDDYIYNSNPVMQFVDEKFSNEDFNEMEEEARMCQIVYDEYRTFCVRKGFKNPLSSNSLGQEMKRLGFERIRLGTNIRSKRDYNTVYKRPYIYIKK